MSIWRNPKRDKDIGKMTNIFDECKTPSLFSPRKFCNALQSDKKFPLEVDELIETRKEQVNCVLIHQVGLGE